VPKGQLAVSNMPEASRATSEDGRRTTFSFDSSPPLPTYLVAFAVGPLDVHEAKDAPVPLRVITTRGKVHLGDLALATASEQIGALSSYFDMAFPYPKVDLVAIPEFGAGAMENAGLITFREDILLADATTASPRARRRMETVLAHELAHHWFGNLVTMAWWDDLWLNEGVATFFEARIPALTRGEVDRTQQLLAGTSAMSLDALDATRPVRMPVRNANDAEAAFDAIVYDKGARVVDMIEGWIGEEAFREGLRRHVRAHAHASATSADLFGALSEASGKDVGAVASTFLDRPGVPLVRAALRCEGGPPRVALTQSRYRARERRPTDPPDPPWNIPVCVALEGREPACTLLDAKEAELPIGGACPRWMYPNAGERGYYRSGLDAAGFRALSRAGAALDPRVRFGALDDGWALVESGDASVDVVFDLLEGFRRDRSRLVVERVAAALRDLDRTVVEDRTRPAFARFAAAQLLPVAREVGWETVPNEGDDRAALRRASLGALALLAPERVAKDAEPRARAFLEAIEHPGGEGAAQSLDLDVAAIALRAVARGADEALWNRLERALRSVRDANERNAVIGALASVGEPALVERTLDLAASGNLRKQEAIAILLGVGERSEARPLLVGWLARGGEQLRAEITTPSLLVRALDAFTGVCDARLHAELARVLPRTMAGVDGADRRVDQVLEGIQRCVAVRAREADRAAKRLP
jgi:aminopeptidase N